MKDRGLDTGLTQSLQGCHLDGSLYAIRNP